MTTFEPCTDEYLTKLWEHINWDSAEQKLLDMQAQISRAAIAKMRMRSKSCSRLWCAIWMSSVWPCAM